MFNVYEAIDDIIDDINVDYYESCYDAIYEELCNRVAYGELTIEEAEMINDVAAEKYLTEGNAFNRVVNDKANKQEKINNRINAIRELRSGYDGDDKYDKFTGKMNDKIRNLRNEYEEHNIKGRKYWTHPKEYRDVQNAASKQGYLSANDRQDLRDLKQDWMYAHGNKGVRPEERYVAGRYLKAQQDSRK